ncbi:MAG: MFS transporter [Planctomycetia bacterium]
MTRDRTTADDRSLDATTGRRATPTGTRHVVLAFAVLLAVITYVDRVCISQAAPQMREDLGLSKEQMGWAFFAFSIAYASFEIPGGWLGDRIGPRAVLMRVVTMWSAFTILTGWAWNFWSLLTFRFLFGVGEAGCFPNLAKVFSLWLPGHERVRAQGIMWLSARWGGAFTPLLVGWMLSKDYLGLHYKWTFLLFGLLGVVWAVLFWSWFRDNPRHHRSVNAAELAIIGDSADRQVGHGAVPWELFLGSPSVWLLWLQYFCQNFSWYFYITWMPTFLKETFPDFTDMQRALAGCVPLFFGGIGSFVSGSIAAGLADRLGSTARARRTLGCVGLCGAAVMLLVSVWLQQLAAAGGGLTTFGVAALLAMGLASFGNDLSMPGSWGACMDIGGKHTGSLAGSMNMMGNFGGALSPVIVPALLTAFAAPNSTEPNWSVAFLLFAAVYAVGGVAWLFIDPVTSLEGGDHD